MPLAVSARLLSTLIAACGLCWHGARAVVNVHLVPHTHDDVGWLKTVDQYYAGLNNTIQHAYVRMILDTVIGELRANPNRTFTYVEQAFFQRWWRQQDQKTKNAVVELVKRGQLSFTNGGWCMHDEATPFYLDMIDQTTLGHRFLMDEFGMSPSIGWQLDPFGHSATQAALLTAEVGMVGLFFARIDYQDLALRSDPSDKAAEFIWRASPSLGDDAQVFTGLTGQYSGTYGPPVGFHFDSLVSEADPFQDDPSLMDYNVKTIVDEFVTKALWQANRTRGENIMWTMGDDFNYESAHEWFFNMDRLIKYVNQDGRVRALYSTPEMYVKAKASETSVSWPLKVDDFFPYADGPHHFWTGYFTSRPALKRYIRDSSSFLQVAKQLAVVGLDASVVTLLAGLETFQEAMGVAQHHDAVSGTAKQHVTFDYARRLARGQAETMQSLSTPLQTLAKTKATFEYCLLRNESLCGPTQADAADVEMVLWNGLGQERSELIELPIASPSKGLLGSDGGVFAVLDGEGKEVPVQRVPSPPAIGNYGEASGGSSETLLFKAEMPPLGFQTYRLVSKTGTETTQSRPKVATNGDATLENDFIKVGFSNGTMAIITDKAAGNVLSIVQSWLWYEGSTGNEQSSQASGAYIFRPTSSEAQPVFNGTPSLKFVSGDLADEVHQTFGDWVSQRIRLPKNSPFLEFTFTVGPIPVSDNKGKEIITRFSTNMTNQGECYTDSNGREMLYRKKDFRASWNFTQTEPVAGNYFPITTSVFIKSHDSGNSDAAAQLTLLTDAAQAGSGCVREGELEMMVHRDLLQDDGRGVGEPLNETQFVNPYVGSNQGQHYGPGLVIRGQHRLLFSATSAAAKAWRPMQDQLYMPVRPFFAKGEKVEVSSFSALSKALPANVQLLTLEPWNASATLLRLAHQFGKGEDSELSGTATVDLKDLFSGRSVEAVEEQGLAATIPRTEVLKRRVAWPVEGSDADVMTGSETLDKSSLKVTLTSLQIGTYLVKFAALSLEPTLIV
mmetsp:Transcript_69979/g.152665  ORF Transcript_69979/g.152665 Transcript_69979/m.152665 type:complete len:1011 (-) Transcript_69979:481-3513(-)